MYDPNTRHCFYGADADLIMISLLTHESNFMIIREKNFIKKTKQGGVQRLEIQNTFNFQLIFISLVREYFQLKYSSLAIQMHIGSDFEHVIDDFVFFCFSIGNNFLPFLSARLHHRGRKDILGPYLAVYRDSRKVRGGQLRPANRVQQTDQARAQDSFQGPSLRESI